MPLLQENLENDFRFVTNRKKGGRLMPACARKRGDKWRVVECDDGSLVRNKEGTPIDGGGHDSERAAQRQASAINISQRG